MISWIILTILAAIILAVSYVIDKFVLIKQKPIVVAIFSTLVFLIGPIIIFLIRGIPKISLIAAVFSLLAGFFFFYHNLFLLQGGSRRGSFKNCSAN